MIKGPRQDDEAGGGIGSGGGGGDGGGGGGGDGEGEDDERGGHRDISASISGNSDPDVASALDEIVAQLEDAPPEGGRALEQQRALLALNDRYMRLAADFDTFRRRTLKERQEIGARAQASLAATLLEPLDDLARVTSLNAEGTDAASVVAGVELVARKLLKSLAAAGLEVVHPLDQTFDPALHEAVSSEPAESPEEDDLISAVFQSGYLFQGQLLRPARVAVRKWNG